MLDVVGNVRRWWFVIHASENVLLDLEGSWDQLQLQTGWKFEPCFKPSDPVTSNVDPQISLDADADVVLPARDSDNNQASQESVRIMTIIKPLRNLFRTITTIKPLWNLVKLLF